MTKKVIDPAPIIKDLADRCLKSKGLECSVLGRVIDLLKAAPAVDDAPYWATERAYKNGYEAGKKDALKWIPVTERLPDAVAPYLVLTKAGNCSVQWFHIHGENFKGFYHAEEPGKITHWMPLPDPPKEDE